MDLSSDATTFLKSLILEGAAGLIVSTGSWSFRSALSFALVESPDSRSVAWGFHYGRWKTSFSKSDSLGSAGKVFQTDP